jgi:hypothetical protein
MEPCNGTRLLQSRFGEVVDRDFKIGNVGGIVGSQRELAVARIRGLPLTAKLPHDAQMSE